MLKSKNITIVLIAVLLLSTLNLKAQPTLDSLQNLLSNHSTRDSTRVNLLIDIAVMYLNGDKDIFFRNVNEAREISYDINYTIGKATTYRLLASFFLIKNFYDSALPYIDKSFALFDSIGNKRGIGGCYATYSRYYTLTDNYSKAIDFSFKAIDKFEEINNKVLLSKMSTNLGSIFLTLEEYDKALKYYTRASEFQNELGDRSIKAMTLTNIADVYIARGQFENAIQNLEQALEIAQEIVLPTHIPYMLSRLAKSHFLKKDNLRSIAYYEQALAMSNKYEFKGEISDNLVGLAEVYLEEKAYSKAKKYAEDGLKLAEDLGHLDRLNRAYKILADLNYATENYKEAFEFHRKHKSSSDSLFSEKNIKALTNIENQYEFEKEKEKITAKQAKKEAIQQAEIKQQKLLRNIFIGGSSLLFVLAIVAFRNLFLKRAANKLLTIQKDEIEEKSKELARINRQLKESHATKDTFFKIVSHDLRAPFNSIIGLSQLLLSTHSESDNQRREEMIKMLIASSTNTYNFLENLLKWSLSQTGTLGFNPSHAMTGSIISRTFGLVGNVAKNKKIALINASNEDLDIYADKDQIETILRNLVSNSIKFTNENGSIKVHTNQNEQEIIFSIEDTGIGMDKGKIDKLFNIVEKTSTPGTNNEKGTGLGLILCKEFVEMHQGKIWVESVVGRGSKFHFSIPKN